MAAVNDTPPLGDTPPAGWTLRIWLAARLFVGWLERETLGQNSWADNALLTEAQLRQVRRQAQRAWLAADTFLAESAGGES